MTAIICKNMGGLNLLDLYQVLVLLVTCSNRLGKVAGLLGRVENLIVEDREVESQTKPYGVRGLHVFLADLKCILVSLLRVVNCGWIMRQHHRLKK